MVRVILCILSLCLILPSLAGQYEDAMNNGDKIFLYLHSPTCGYCQKFNPIYKKLFQNYNKDCKFIMIDTSSNYGRHLMKLYQAKFVPYVLIVDSKAAEVTNIIPECLLEYSCAEKYVKKLIK